MVYRRFVPDEPYRLHVKGDRFAFARITGAQLDDLLNLLVQERWDDRDYYIDENTIAYLERQGADLGLLNTLAEQLGPSKGIEIEWARANDEP